MDALVLNAGVGEPAMIVDTTGERFDRVFGVNVRGHVLAMRAAAPVLRDGGGLKQI